MHNTKCQIKTGHSTLCQEPQPSTQPTISVSVHNIYRKRPTISVWCIYTVPVFKYM